MECRYILTHNIYETGENIRIGFGIAAVEKETAGAIVLESFSDLSADVTKVEQLVRISNEIGLDPIQLSDVVQDFLVEN
ncbi:MAG: hypothetical protein IJW79_12550 [Clostridia bacterium]|nr:hypothetical protein [Clostridia bacterium]